MRGCRFIRGLKRAVSRVAWATPEAYSALMGLVPYKRIGEADEVGVVAGFLATDLADYITGTSIYIDGGMKLYAGFESEG
jgi:glucose 1-dehydrogenase